MTNPLKVAIAGYGVVGKLRRKFIDARQDMNVVCVSDHVLETDGVFEDGVKFFNDYTKLFAEDFDILFVCLSNDVAAEATIRGLEKGCHVFCEKPPGRDVDDIRKVLEVKKRHPELVLKYGFNHRYHDSVQEALKLVRSGKFGRIVNMRGMYGKSQLISYGQTTWRTKRELAGGGILLDQGIHMVDLIRLFGGEFEEIHSFISNDFWHHDVEDNAYALMRSREGVVAQLHSSSTQWRHSFRLELTLEKGAINLSGILSGSKSYGAETMTVLWANEDDRGDPMEQTTRYVRDPSWESEIMEFADAVFNGAAITNGCPEDALKTMELVYRIYCADPTWAAKWNLKV